MEKKNDLKLEMPTAKQYLLDLTGHTHFIGVVTACSNLWEPICQKPRVKGERTHEGTQLTEELLATEGCWQSESKFSSEM